MEVKLNVSFKQLLQLVRQLSDTQKRQLQETIEMDLQSNGETNKSPIRKAGTLKGFITYMAEDFDAPLLK